MRSIAAGMAVRGGGVGARKAASRFARLLGAGFAFRGAARLNFAIAAWAPAQANLNCCVFAAGSLKPRI